MSTYSTVIPLHTDLSWLKFDSDITDNWQILTQDSNFTLFQACTTDLYFMGSSSWGLANSVLEWRA